MRAVGQQCGKKRGMSYNWEIRGKKISGYCNVNGKGTITEFKQGI
jgi:hypothetical protein